MKSDQEFIKGIYEKAEELRRNEENITNKTKDKQQDWMIINKKPNVVFRFGTAAAVFLVMLSAAIFLGEPKDSGELIMPQTYGFPDVSVRSVNLVEQLFQISTEIVEIDSKTTDGKTAVEIIHTYQGDSKEADILSAIDSHGIDLNEGQTAVVFLQSGSDGLVVLDVFKSDLTQTDTYINQFGEKITRDEIDRYKSPLGFEGQ